MEIGGVLRHGIECCLPSKATWTLFLCDRPVLSEGLLKEVAGNMSPEVEGGLLLPRRFMTAVTT